VVLVLVTIINRQWGYGPPVLVVLVAVSQYVLPAGLEKIVIF